MRYKKAHKPEMSDLTKLEAAKAEVVTTLQNYLEARTNAHHAFAMHIVRSLPYVARATNLYERLAPADAVEVISSLEKIANIVSRYESAAAESRVPTQDAATKSREQREEHLATLAENGPSLTRGQKAAYARMSPGQKAAYTKRLKKENVKTATEAAPSEVVPYDREKAQELRKKLGYTRPQLAKRLKLSPYYITALESGQSEVAEEPRGTKMKQYLRWYRNNIGA